MVKGSEKKSVKRWRFKSFTRPTRNRYVILYLPTGNSVRKKRAKDMNVLERREGVLKALDNIRKSPRGGLVLEGRGDTSKSPFKSWTLVKTKRTQKQQENTH